MDVIDAIDAIEVQKRMLWAAREGAMAVWCDRKNEAREFGCRRCAKKCEQICAVQESKAPSCLQSCLVLALLVC